MLDYNIITFIETYIYIKLQKVYILDHWRFKTYVMFNSSLLGIFHQFISE